MAAIANEALMAVARQYVNAAYAARTAKGKAETAHFAGETFALWRALGTLIGQDTAHILIERACEQMPRRNADDLLYDLGGVSRPPRSLARRLDAILAGKAEHVPVQVGP